MRIKHAYRVIQDDMLNRQEVVLDREIFRQDLEITEISSGQKWAFRDELKQMKSAIRRLRKELHRHDVERPTLIDKIKIWFYNWSIRGRIE